MVLGLVAVMGCNDETECTSDCDPGASAVFCRIGLQTHTICSASQDTAALQCASAGGNWSPATVCAEVYTETGGDNGSPSTPWEPGRSITLDPTDGEYVIDQVFFEELKADPAPLNHDSTVLRESESGHYEVLEVGELSDALGWEARDLLLSVDSHELLGIAGFVDAYSSLADNAEFQLTVKRGRDEVVLRYRVE